MATNRRRNPNPRPGELATIHPEASQHALSTGPRKGVQVGTLKADVLEGLRTAIDRELAAGAGAAAAQLRADLAAINEERRRRWKDLAT